MNTNVAGVLFIAFTTLLQHFSLLIVTTILMLWSFGGFAKFPLTFYPTGRCNRSASGYDGPWTPTPTTFNNAYFTILSNLKWVPKEWDGPYQYVDASTGRLMMLPTDLVLLQDAKFKRWVDVYAKDGQKFNQDFSKAFQKLEELGTSGLVPTEWA